MAGTAAQDSVVRFHRFCASAHALARCLTAVIPEFGDQLFSCVAHEILDGAPPEVGDAPPQGVWLRSSSGGAGGYIFIGPPGSPHFYMRDKPEDVDEAEMQVQRKVPPGRLVAMVDNFLKQAHRLASGQSIPVHTFGCQQFELACPPGEQPRAAAAHVLLDNALRTARGETAAGAMRTSMGQYLEAMLTLGTLAAADEASKEIAAMREACAADAPLASLALLRPALAKKLPNDRATHALISKTFECLGAGGNAERMLGRVVADYAEAGQAALLTTWIDDAILAMREQVEAAKDARSMDDHGHALYRAAALGYTARAVAQILLEIVAPALWPPGTTRDLLEHYVGMAEETTVRTAYALVIAAINAGSGLALEHHRAAVKAQGAEKADELIEQYFFYPRCDRNLLVDT